MLALTGSINTGSCALTRARTAAETYSKQVHLSSAANGE